MTHQCLVGIALLFLHAACVTVDHGSSRDVDSTPKLNAELDIATGQQFASRPAVVGQMFCPDDIYTRHLVEEFLREHGDPSTGRPTGKRSRAMAARSARSRQSAALAFARSVMAGDDLRTGLPVVTNGEVERWMNYFTHEGRPSFLRWLIRAESMRHFLQPILRQEGIPEEMIYLAMIESGLSSKARSRAKAMGPWQFMQGTAKLYGLEVNYWVDERRDPVKSTIAAARYLRDLYTELGDWYLAMAAYNSGPGKIRSAMRKAGTRDFWQLARTKYLKTETSQYVPKMLAAMLVARDSQAQGFVMLAHPELEVPEHRVVLPKPVLLSDVAKLLEVDISVLRAWNPELLRDITPPRRRGAAATTDAGYPLRLGAELASRLGSRVDQLAAVEVRDVREHRIARGDSLGSIARRYGISTPSILKYNPGVNARRLRIGSMLMVPVPEVISLSSGHGSTPVQL